jgi:hypothetical protein
MGPVLCGYRTRPGLLSSSQDGSSAIKFIATQGAPQAARRKALAAIVKRIRRRFGRDAVVLASRLTEPAP